MDILSLLFYLKNMNISYYSFNHLSYYIYQLLGLFLFLTTSGLTPELIFFMEKRKFNKLRCVFSGDLRLVVSEVMIINLIMMDEEKNNRDSVFIVVWYFGLN